MLKDGRKALPTQRRLLLQPEVDAALAAHERFMGGRGPGRMVLRFVEGEGLDFRRRLLNDADLTGAVLRGAQFAGAHLERAALFCADLRGCDLRASNLRRADMRGATLAGATLNGAVLDEADLRPGSIMAADGKGGLKRIGRSRKGPLGEDGGADFTNCSMRGVRLRGANLKGADFTGAIMEGAELLDARLAGAIFHDTVLTRVPVGELPFTREQLSRCVLDPTPQALARLPVLRAALEQAAEWRESGGRKGSPARLDGEDLRPLSASFRAQALTALSARSACAIGVDFSGSELQGAVFDGADLRGAVFDNADLRGASFRGAKLSHARFAGADISALHLEDGKLLPVCFDEATMERTDLSQARNAALDELKAAC